MISEIVDLCIKAAESNFSAVSRKGNIIELTGSGKVIVTGDLHGHRRNFEKICSYADLENNPDTYLIFQEILHGGEVDKQGGCKSFKVFFDVLRFKLRFPEQVYLIMGNHDTAIITDSKVLKNGKEMNEAMKDAIKRSYDKDHSQVMDSLRGYLLSQPLAVKTSNGIWISHSLPGDRFIKDFDMAVFDKRLEIKDVERPNSVYLLTWGRRHSEKALEELRQMFDVGSFILGHQTQEKGFFRAGKNLIILISEHNHGSLIRFDLAENYSTDELMNCIVPLASIA
ncbi:MAG: metallophosphoesterase [Sedimentisphaerales bacterium]|nr:metallophosphoesterase [Sedimentisphaerales bacterium]